MANGKKIIRVVGARPQFMQVPILEKELANREIEHYLLHTGQHYDPNMSDVFFSQLNITVNENLNIGSGRHGETTGKMLSGIEAVLISQKPDAVVVDGDTNTTLAAALAASKLHIPVVHIEAGFRDENCKRPEEINRKVTDHISTLNCAPLPRTLKNLRNENLGDRSVLTGDVLLDCFLSFQTMADENILNELNLQPSLYHVATVHREENTIDEPNSRFFEIIQALTELDKKVILPLHPRCHSLFDKFLQNGGKLNKLTVIEPVPYLKMQALVKHCDCVITDSGGLPREAVWSGKRCVMLFQEDTLHDLIERKKVQIAKGNKQTILNAFEKAEPVNKDEYIELFGNGNAAKKIADHIDRLI